MLRSNLQAMDMNDPSCRTRTAGPQPKRSRLAACGHDLVFYADKSIQAAVQSLDEPAMGGSKGMPRPNVMSHAVRSLHSSPQVRPRARGSRSARGGGCAARADVAVQDAQMDATTFAAGSRFRWSRV